MVKDGGVGCTYVPRKQYRNSGTDVHPSISHCDTTKASDLPSQTSILGPPSAESQIHPPSHIPLLTWPNHSEPVPSLLQKPTAAHPRQEPPLNALIEIVLGQPSDVSVVQKTHNTMEHAPLSTASSFAVLPSIHFRPIPLSLRVPLSLIPPERVQISPIAGGDLEMTLCVILTPGISPDRVD